MIIIIQSTIQINKLYLNFTLHKRKGRGRSCDTAVEEGVTGRLDTPKQLFVNLKTASIDENWVFATGCARFLLPVQLLCRFHHLNTFKMYALRSCSKHGQSDDRRVKIMFTCRKENE